MAAVTPLTLSVNVRSDQRSTCCDPAESRNPTNGVTVPFLTSSQAPVREIAFGTVEMPLPQYLVEHEWSRLYFSEGVSLVVDNHTNEPLREFGVEVNGTVYRALLPMWLNPVIAVDASDPTSPIFTTLFAHALESRDAWAAPPEGPDPATLTATPVDPEAVGWRRLTPAP